MDKRNRYLYFILIIIVIMMGLLSRKVDSMPTFIKTYLPDTLWGLMVFFIMAFIFNKSSTLKITIYSLIFSYCIEISQLYHGVFIDNIRRTTLGGLVLGFGFLWSDLVCYSVGVLIGYLLDKYYIK
ncbi:ribosomal maturation YjgA family protein [Tepidibacter sp. Z1-5]|uniref:ribosomal maturation YjgA family protein n=1 Tax=Tepidibacter sp. Z1-5 TaxID=3134138 RepID=UPI0030C58B45